MDNRISFMNDYSEGACEEILRRMSEENHAQHTGYGLDSLCEEAKECIYQEMEMREASIHFLVGGTQTNRTVIAAALRPYEAVIAAKTGHINVHETGAIKTAGIRSLLWKRRMGNLRLVQSNRQFLHIQMSIW